MTNQVISHDAKFPEKNFTNADEKSKSKYPDKNFYKPR